VATFANSVSTIPPRALAAARVAATATSAPSARSVNGAWIQ